MKNALPKLQKAVMRHRRILVCLLMAGILLGMGYSHALAETPLGAEGETLFSRLKALYTQITPGPLRYFIWSLKRQYSQFYIYFIVASVLLLQRMIPAQKGLRTFSKGFFQDFVWFNLLETFYIMGMPIYIGALRVLYDTHLSFLTIHAVEGFAMGWRLLLSVLMFDFLQWFHHVVRHRGVLWYFHMVHHSQKEMNLFTDGRMHLAEPVIAQTLIFVPMFMFQLDPNVILLIVVFRKWYQRVYHANLRTNYGFFKYFMVTPQSHRVHHSSDERHFNKNYGVLFSIWDHLFGTQYRHYEEYPAKTGIADESFPTEQRVQGAVASVRNFGLQLWYPFGLLLHDARQKVRRA